MMIKKNEEDVEEEEKEAIKKAYEKEMMIITLW